MTSSRSDDRLLNAILAVAVIAAVLPLATGQASAVVSASGTIVLVLAATYLIIGIWGERLRGRIGSPIADLAYFGAQLAIPTLMGFLDDGRSAFWVLYFPVVSQATFVFAIHRALIVGGIAMFSFGVLTATVMEGGNVGQTLVMFGAFLAFVIVVSRLLVRESQARRDVERMAEELGEANERLQAYAGQVEELTAAKERARLARDLHDSVTQTLFSVTLSAEAVRLTLDDQPEQAKSHVAKLQELSHGALREMRSLVDHLRLAAVPEGDLVPTLRHHFETEQKRRGLIVTFDALATPALNQQQEECLFRIAQEALNNIYKHASTNNAHFVLSHHDGTVRLEVEDDGVGIGHAPDGPQGGGVGMSSMRERAEMLGGTLRIEPREGGGTKVIAEVPYANGQ